MKDTVINFIRRYIGRKEKTFLVEYTFAGDRYCLEIYAADMDTAIQTVLAIRCTAKVIGEAF